MDEARLRELIQNGESSWLEFKLDQLQPEGLAREMVAHDLSRDEGRFGKRA